MNEYIAEDKTPQEFQFLEQLIHYRMGDGGRPTFAFIENWSLPLQKYILSARIKNEDEIILLLIALAPHAVPESIRPRDTGKNKRVRRLPRNRRREGEKFQGLPANGANGSLPAGR